MSTPTLKELLQKSRAAKEALKDGPQIKTNSQLSPQEARQEVSEVREKSGGIGENGGETPSTIIGGNGSGIQLSKSAALSTRPLTALERIKLGKTNIETLKVIEVEVITPNGIGPTIVNQIAEKIQDKHISTSDGITDVDTLRRNLEYLANNIEQVELVGQIVRTIAVQLRQNPALSSYMKDEDVNLVVRGLRRSYNIAMRRRVEKVEKKSNKSALDNELADAFKNLGIG